MFFSVSSCRSFKVAMTSLFATYLVREVYSKRIQERRIEPFFRIVDVRINRKSMLHEIMKTACSKLQAV